jgi:parallel beta-helix repeat protein
MIRIYDFKSMTTLKAAVMATGFLLFALATGFGQVVNLTAGPATTTLPDGTTLPMWGYSCGTASSAATCAPLSGSSSAAGTGALGGIYVLNGGSGYSSATTVTISGGGGTGAQAAPVISGGVVVGFSVTNHGSGYTSAPTVTINDPAATPGTGAVAAAAPAWSPIVITVPWVTNGASLTINLTNNLSFTPAGGGTANAIPTSVVILGQVGGGLGIAPTTAPSPNHSDAQGCPTWYIASLPPGTPCTAPVAGASGTPPTQANRVQSMATEVTAGAAAPTTLTWAKLKPGTYLLESGTHPSIQVPMGLIGMLVVTTPPTSSALGQAYPAVVSQTSAAAQATVPAVNYNAEVPLEFSEIDPVQNKAVDQAVRTAGFSETMVWSGLPTSPQGTPGCGYPGSATYHQCYPPAVNYTPFYFLINGVAFDKANATPSLFAASIGSATPPVTGTLLVRLVNAGLRMHVPSIVGPQTQGFSGSGTPALVNGFTLIAEDGNPIPNLKAPRVKTEVFMAAGKTYDVMVNVPTANLGVGAPPSLPIFDRELALSANSSVRDAGMLAYISVNGATLPVGAGSGVLSAAVANPDTYASVIPCSTGSCIPLVITDPSKGVIANDINVYGVALSAPPTNGTLTCTAVPGNPVAGICANGTFTYTPIAGAAAISSTAYDSFGYCANGAAGSTANLCTTVTLNVSSLSGNPVANAITYTSRMATFLKIPSPGPLSVASDPSGLPLQVAVSSVTPANGVTINMDPQGGFTASAPGPGTYTFTYAAQNSQGRTSSPATVTLVFPQPSNLQVNVLDAQAYNNCNGSSSCISGLLANKFTDYRWIIEEDKTFWIDPNCTTNASSSTAGCPGFVGTGGTIPVFGVQFHTSSMDFVAQGCTGPMSCEGGQTMLDTRPACNTGSTTVPAGCSTTSGTHIPAVCDLGNGACRPDPTGGNGLAPVLPSQVALDPSKRYYISVLPGDAANPYPAYLGAPACPSNGGESPSSNGTCGHAMSGAPIPPACNILGGSNACTSGSAFTNPVNVLALPTPLPTGKLSVLVFEDDFPLNGEQDGGGGAGGAIAPVEPGLGGFNLVLWDTYGTLGDPTGQNSNDEFNQPLSNSLAGTVDPSSGLDACPLTPNPLQATGQGGLITGNGAGTAQATAMTGMIVTCPKYEADGHTLSPLAGQAVISNLMPEKFSVQAYPGADRIARGEEWIQTNTLDGQHPHDAFIEIGDPSYFQEYGPAGYHVMIGFANPAIINARHDDVCKGFGTPGAVGPCTNSIDGSVDVERLSRIPDERLYPSGSRDALAWTQCWVSLGDPDGEDFMFTKCDANGNFRFSNVPGGNWRLTIGDQWNDQIIDGLSTPANVGCTSTAANQPTNATTCPGGQALHMGNVGVQQWQSNLYTRTYIDDNKDGIREPNEIGIPLIYTMIHYRDGHNANALNTDFNGVANFNETFPLFNWYVVEADSTRYKTTGIHTVYDAGGPADGTTSCGPGNGARACGSSPAYKFMTNTFEAVPLPADLSVPGAVYCKSADCSAEAASFAAGTAIPSSSTASTGRIDPPYYFGGMEAWSGLTGHSNWIDIGKAPYAACPPACVNVTNSVSNPAGGTTPTTTQVGENGGIYGQVAYASTRPFDDASQMIQQPWEPNIPGVTVNLYQEGFAADGVTPTLTMVDTTTTSSWDAWAQGFYPGYTDPASGTPLPYMSCPGQGTNVAGAANQDLFYFTLFDQPNYLDWYTTIHNGGTTPTPLPYHSQYKCYDAMKINNQFQPAPYDGKYYFPSSLGINPATGKLVPTVGTTNGVHASMAGTNCTICVANPDSTDKYRVGTPMLPPGKYVVQVIMPPGYEVYKEEDKNLLIGDNFIAPVTQQFGGLGTDIFILPDQASVASMYDESGAGYNPTNYQNSTTASGLADELSGVPGFPGYTDPVWPCVGEMRVVPDFLSLYPNVQESAPFAGATRPLCDRKEVTLTNQMAVNARFFLFTSTHIAAKYTGVITDDFTSEFDPFAPQFGEKFAPPNLPISTRDYLGNELSRVYSDHWGTYDGLTFSSWDVNPPNITGYSPSMMTQCMNDPGPITDTNPSSPTYGQLIQDPLYNPAYSDFCYINPFMPGVTTYNDTPVVPTQAFVGAGYNNPDCSYPDATPAVAEVDGDGIGPWVSKATNTLHITALGNQQVSNNSYSGPSANTVPFASKTISRHYGFGSQCTATAVTAGNATCNTVSSVTIGGKAAPITSWSDTAITVTVPAGVANCAIQQQTQYGGSTAQCGQLVITAGNGKQSVDAVTVTIGGKQPTHVGVNQTVQSAIDAANPGDLIIVDPTCTTGGTTTTCSSSSLQAGTQKATTAAHNEMLLMWKPVRLQGVGAPSSIIDAGAFPAGKLLDPWRRHVNCLFGLTLSGVPIGTPIPSTTGGASTPAAYDPSGTYSCPETGWNNFSATPNSPQVDRIPLEAVVGWDATLNGNLAEQLQEPSLMGAYEGAGVTVLAKGVYTPPGQNSFGVEGAFPAGSLLLQNVPAALDSTGAVIPQQHDYCTVPTARVPTELKPNPYPSNFECNPSSVDGLTIRDATQGGGGVFVHGWNHNLQIANNRIYNNAGTLSGGINLGQGEFPDANTITATTSGRSGFGQGEQSALDVLPSCQNSNVIGTHLPYCLDLNVNMHNNFITSNSSLGDELFSGTLAGGGGASFCTGSDYYKFNYNWVCGNVSSAEGGGVTHLGFTYDGDIEHNTIALNESSNPTIPTNGGGIMVMGTPDTDPTCTSIPDADCPPGLSDGTGPNLVINANLIQANGADSGSGGGIRLQQVNGTDVSTFYNQPTLWNSVAVTNNIIVNNIAGWDGAGISLQDSLNVTIQNNTISSNDTLASSGVLTQSIGTPVASAPAGSCTQAGNSSASCPQSAGVTSMQNSTLLTTTFSGLPGALTCPFGTSYPCKAISNPLLQNNVIWQNRSFYIGVGGPSAGLTNQQNQVALFDAFTGTGAPAQTAFGQCVPGTSYWDIGVRGDLTVTGHESGFKLNPTYSVLDDTGYAASNLTTNPSIASQYCNGTRVPPTCSVADGCGGPSGYGVPPGVVDASAPNPVFSLTPAATVDEGNNWINVSWGPLALSDDSVTGGVYGNYGGGNSFGNYSLNSNSPAIDYVPVAQSHPTTDFFGNPRPDPALPTRFDVGAIEYQGTGTLPAVLTVTGGPLAFGNQVVGTTSTAKTLTLSNTGAAGATGIALSFSSTVFTRPAAGGTCGTTLAAGATCTINVVFTPTATGSATGTLTIAASVAVNGSPVALSGTGVAPVVAATLTPATWTVSQTRNCPGTGLGVIACSLDPAQAFTLTNTGNVTLTGIAQGVLGGTAANDANYTVVRLLSTCGPAGGGQLAGDITLAPGATCNIEVQFKPLTSQAAGLKSATISVTDAAGTQTSNLNGTAQ